MSKKVTYNLNFLAKSVFELDKEHQKILQILAHQEDDKGINQTQITSYFSDLDSIHNRKTIKRKLIGTNKKIGLIPNEYIIPKKEQKKRYGRDEITFHLTFKGLFGALASGISLKRIYSYKKFLKGVDHYVTDKKINKIIKKYYELQIQSFLLWHYIYGIQLKNMTMFQTYYSQFDEKELSHIENFGIRVHPNIIKESHDTEKISKKANLRDSATTRGKERIFVTEIMNTFSSYFAYKGIINVLRINSVIPTAIDLLKQNMYSVDTDEALDFDKLIDHWSTYIEGVHLAEFPRDVLYSDAYVMPNQDNITFLPQGFREDIKKYQKKSQEEKLKKTLEKIKKYEKTYNIAYIPDVINEIQKMLKENDIEIDIPDGMKRPSNVYTF